MQIKIKILLGVISIALVTMVCLSFTPETQDLKMLHETYSKGEANYEFCVQLCTSKGGVNCGGKRIGCCQTGHCKRNTIYGYDECEKGFSQRLGTDYCIGSWD
ncbi:hypothetical protein pb186bvf_003345 [Paramecium bursaria]